MDEIMLRIDNVSKMYKLGQIGGTTLREELQRKAAKMKGQEDPTRQIGAKDYNQGETFMALNGVSFDVKKGERVGIIGHNGAGKSTLLKLISRVTAPTTGKIQMNGRVASMLEVGTGFHGELTGRENIYMNGAILGMTRKEIDAKIEDIIEFSEVRQFIDTPVKRYSSGMYVKLAFSVAAHLDSEIMIMDEVLAVGDMAFQKKCLDKMNDVSRTQGRTILYVSHNMNTIRQLCDRVVVLDHGKVVFDGDVEEGIAIYMKSDEDQAKTHYIYDKSYHKNGRSVGKVNIKELTILNGEDTAFQQDETIQMEIVCSAIEQMDNIKFRFEIKYVDGTLAGTSISAQGIRLEGEQNKLYLELNTKGIVSGRYKADIIAYFDDECGQEYFLDGVYPGFSFTIQEKDGELVWLHQHWGHVRFKDVLVTVAK